MSWTALFKDSWRRGQRLAATWANQVSRALNRMELVDGQGEMYIGSDGGIKIHINPEAILGQDSGILGRPFRITVDSVGLQYNVTAGTIWCRSAGSLAVSAVSGVAVTETSWIYVPVTISTAGTVTAGAITASVTEPTYWDRDGGNQTVINLILGKIDVTDSVATIEYNTTGDRDLYAHAGQTVALSHADNPATLLAAHEDSAGYGTSDTLLVYCAAQGSAPSRTVRLFLDAPAQHSVEIAELGGGVNKLQLDGDEAAPGAAHIYGVDSGGDKGWLSPIEYLSQISGYDAGETQFLIHESGTLTWKTAGTCVTS